MISAKDLRFTLDVDDSSNDIIHEMLENLIKFQMVRFS